MGIVFNYNHQKGIQQWLVVDGDNILSIQQTKEDAEEFLRLYKAIKKGRGIWSTLRFF